MEAKESFLGQLGQRLTTETPKFFKKILTFGIWLAGVGAAILLIDKASLPVPIPEVVISISGYLVTAGAVCAAVAGVTTTNPTLQDAGGSLARTARVDKEGK